jgi:FixJ family two-component response regulator
MGCLVAVVDDDISVRESLESLIRSVGMQVKLFASAEEFLSAAHTGIADCLVLDVRLPGMSGLDLHRYLLGQNCKLPAIFITAHASDERARLEARSDWTVAYLTKPFGEDEFLDAVDAALKWKPSIKTN